MTNQFDKILSVEQKVHISNRWTEAYVEKLLSALETFAPKWRLNNIQLNPFYSQNCVFTCFSEVYGDAVLKVGYSSLAVEYYCLREFAGRGVCKLFDGDLERDAILEQRIIPGTSLMAVSSQDDRIDIFASLFENLHVAPNGDTSFPTIQEVLSRRLDYIETREDCEVFSQVIRKAKITLQSLCSKYSSRKLLHADLHHENILLSQNQNYVIIDPVGYLGDPVFDVSRFIMREFGDDLTSATDLEILDLIAKVADRLHMSANVLIQCLLVDNVSWISSDLQQGETLDDSQFIVNNIFTVERLLSCR